MSPSPPKHELFRMVPVRVAEALRRHQLTVDQFGLGVFLFLADDYRTHTYSGSLKDIRRDANWRKSDDALLRALKDLRAVGWIDYRSYQGKRTTYQIRLTGLRRRELGEAGFDGPPTEEDGSPPRDFRAEGHTDAEVTSASRKSQQSASQHEEPHRGTGEPPLPQKVASSSTPSMRDDDALGGGTKDKSVGAKPPEQAEHVSPPERSLETLGTEPRQSERPQSIYELVPAVEKIVPREDLDAIVRQLETELEEGVRLEVEQLELGEQIEGEDEGA